MSKASFEQFDGGITDQEFDAAPNVSSEMDNLLVSVEGKPYQRGGALLFDRAAPRPGSTIEARSMGLVDFNAQYLGALVPSAGGQYLYTYEDSVWTRVTGPNTNYLLAGGESDTVSYGEWKKHWLFTNDAWANGAGSHLPVKAYLNSSGDVEWVTAGLPTLEHSNYTDANLLTACYALANDLKAQILAHMNDYNLVPATTIHININAPYYSALSITPDATTPASLYGLTNTLQVVLSEHIQDAKAPGTATYHYNSNADPRANINELPLYPGGATPTTLAIAAASLDDMARKYYWHIWSTFTHGSTVKPSYSTYGLHSVSAAYVGPISSDPIVKANFKEAVDLANEVKSSLNSHFAQVDIYNHWRTDTTNTITAADAATSDTYPEIKLYNLIHHCRMFYQAHGLDIPSDSLTPTVFTATTNGTTTLTAVAYVSGTLLTSLYGDTYTIYRDISSDLTDLKAGSYPVSYNSGAATMVISQTANSSTAGRTFRIVFSKYHTTTRSKYDDLFSYNAADANSVEQDKEYTVGTDLESWIEILWAVGQKYAIHVQGTDGSPAYYTGADYFHRQSGDVTDSHVFKITKPKPLVTEHLYAFHYQREYQVGTTTFTDKGPVTYVGPIEGVMTTPTRSAYSTYPVSKLPATVLGETSNYTWTNPYVASPGSAAVSNIRSLTNTASTNYSTSTMTVELYRTVTDGTVHRFLASISNGTTTYTDSTNDTIPATPTDTSLAEQEAVYTSGDVVDNDPPPYAKFVHVVGNVALYGYIQDAGEDFPNRVRQSIEDDIDACPGDFYVDLDFELKGLSSTRGRPLAFTTKAAYRLDGLRDELGGGQMVAEKLSDLAGCAGQASIVQIEEGVVWAGQDGFYFTDGVQVLKISEHLPLTFAALTNTETKKKRLSGVYVPLERRVYWACQWNDDDSVENDGFIVLDLRKGIKPAACFTTASNLAPTSLLVYKNQFILGDKRGYTLVLDPDELSDLWLDSGATVDLWSHRAIVYTLTSVHSHLGAMEAKKWVAGIQVAAKGTHNLSLQIHSTNDGGRKEQDLVPIRFRGRLTWDDEGDATVFGDTGIEWDNDGNVRVRRRFGAGHLRCSYKQVSFSNADVPIINSDSIGTATVALTPYFGTAVLDSYAASSGTPAWLSDPVGYYLTFAHDDYETRYAVVARTSDSTLTFADPHGTGPTGSVAWRLEGQPKGEFFYLLGYTLVFQPMQAPGGLAFQNRAGESGENA